MFDFLETEDGPAMPEALQLALAAMPEIDPFFAAMLMSLKLIECPPELAAMVPVMATNCVDTILYNSAGIAAEPDKWTPAVLAAVLAHECMHILRLDGELLLDSDRELANIASDACINRDLRGAGWNFPGLNMSDPIKNDSTGCDGIESSDPFALTPSIYRVLMQRKKLQEPTPDSGKLGNDGLTGEYKKAEKAAGGAQGVEQQVQDLAANAARLAKQIAEANGLTQPAPEAPESATDDDSGEATNYGGNGWGLEDSAASRALELLGITVKRPNVRLLRVAGAKVRGILRSKTRRTRSLMTPAPISDDMGRLIAGPRRAMDYRIAVAIDASGSVSQQQLNLFTAAAHTWCQQFASRKREIHVCYWSNKLCASGPISDFVDGTKVPNSGGGTRFTVALDWVATLAAKPTHLLVFTDMQFDHNFEKPEGCEIIWITAPNDAKAYKDQITTGTIVELDDGAV